VGEGESQRRKPCLCHFLPYEWTDVRRAKEVRGADAADALVRFGAEVGLDAVLAIIDNLDCLKYSGRSEDVAVHHVTDFAR